MRKTLLAMTAALLSIVPATAQTSEPIADTANYYYVSADANMMMLLSDSVEARGDVRRVWALGITHDIVQVDGEAVLYNRLLINMDCRARTFRFEEIMVQTTQQQKRSATPEIVQTPIQADTPAAAIEEVICRANRDATRIVSAELVAKAAIAYRARQY